jgi:hypothetical protein
MRVPPEQPKPLTLPRDAQGRFLSPRAESERQLADYTATATRRYVSFAEAHPVTDDILPRRKRLRLFDAPRDLCDEPRDDGLLGMSGQ